LADLPVPVCERSLEPFLHLRAVKDGKGDNGTAAHGWAVAEGSEDRWKAGRVTDGSESGNGGLPAEGVIVAGGDAAQLSDGSHVANLTDGKARRLDDAGVLIAKEREIVRSLERAGQLGGMTAYERGRVAESLGHDPPPHLPHLDEGAEGDGPHTGILIRQETPRRLRVTLEPGQGGRAPPRGMDALYSV